MSDHIASDIAFFGWPFCWVLAVYVAVRSFSRFKVISIFITLIVLDLLSTLWVQIGLVTVLTSLLSMRVQADTFGSNLWVIENIVVYIMVSALIVFKSQKIGLSWFSKSLGILFVLMGPLIAWFYVTVAPYTEPINL